MKKFPFHLFHFDQPGIKVVIRFRQILPFFAFPLLFVWYIMDPTPAAAAGAAGLGGLLLVAYLWARQMSLCARGRRELRYTAFQVGDELEEILHLENSSAFPVLWAEYHDHSTLPGHRASLIRSAGSQSSLFWRVATLCTRRGLYTLGPWELHMAGDPFGIFEVVQQYSESQEVIVYPPLARLPAHLLPHRSTPGERRTLNQPLAAETIHALTTRPVQPQDPLRRIHWPTTARRGEMYVRVMEPESASRLWLAADFNASVQAGEGDDSTVENMVILLASLSLIFLHNGLPTGIFSSGVPPCRAMPHSGASYHWELLRALASIQPAAGQPFAQTLSHLRPLLHAGDIVVAVTPSSDPAWVYQLAALLHSNTSGQPAARAIFLEPSSFDDRISAAPSVRLVQTLSAAGISVQTVRRGDICPVPGAYGELRRWEFKTLATGKVVTMKSPRPAASPSRRVRP